MSQMNPEWPNKMPVPEGVVPESDIPQDADFLDDDDLDLEMED